MPDIGASLREARMRAKIDVSEVEAATKIRAKYLRALENEEWKLLPGPTFVKSFLRTYADHLGLDGKLLVEEYKSRHERPSEIDLVPIGGSRRPRPQPQRGRRGWIIGALIIALLVLFFYLGSRGNSGAPTTSHSGPTAPTARTTRPHQTVKAPARRSQVRLQLTVTAPVWVCLEDAGGHKLIPGVTLTPGGGGRTSFSASGFRLTLGNPAVQLRVDDRSIALPASNNPLGYSITPQSVTPLPSAARPTCA